MKQPHFTKLTLPAPVREENLPLHAQWLAGEGAGSWFCIDFNNNFFEITRFSPQGKIECKGVFYCNASSFDINQPYQFTYLSHCETVNIIQNNQTYVFKQKS